MTTALLIVLFLVLLAEFINGWTDAPNAIATVVATNVLSPRIAILLASLLNILGAMSGVAVANTVGKGIVESSALTLLSIPAAMLAVIVWCGLAGRLGMPVSKSHALIASLAGAGLASAGPEVLLWEGWRKVFIGLGYSTFAGVFAFLIAWIIKGVFASANPIWSKKFFNTLQIFSASFMAYAHGSNDGQKFIGIFALTLMVGGYTSSFEIPYWVIILCAVVMGLGTSIGGWRIIRTIGMRMGGIQSWQGFSAETGAATLIYAASTYGIPLSTTHSINTAIMGVNTAKRRTALRLKVVREIVLAWILTFPACGGLAYLFSLFLNWIF